MSNTPQQNEDVNVLIVDDSALYRQTVARILADVPNVHVVGVAKDGREAVEKADSLQVDVMTLDVEMPEMDGIETLRELARRKLPVRAIMLSSLTEAGARVTMDALFEGALDFIPKPSGGLLSSREVLRDALISKLDAFRAYRRSRRSMASAGRNRSSRQGHGALEPGVGCLPAGSVGPDSHSCDAVIIGVSTGGPQSLRHVIPRLASDFPVPVVIVQHMPAGYTGMMSQRLDEVSEISVVQASDGRVLRPGMVVVAQGNHHLGLSRRGSQVVTRLTSDPPENSCRPSVDYTLRDAARCYEGNLLAVIMTGMGKDGLVGSRIVEEHGGTVFAQDQDTSAVFGMPKSVIDAGLAKRVLPLGRIAAAITRHVHRSRTS